MFIYGLIPRKVSKENPQDVFREFVCDPIPPSVRSIEVYGGLAFAGGNVVIDFEIEEGDRRKLLDDGGFTSADDVTLDAFCPISKEPDYKKCAVKIEKV